MSTSLARTIQLSSTYNSTAKLQLNYYFCSYYTRSSPVENNLIPPPPTETFFETWQVAKLHGKEHGIKHGFAILEAKATNKPTGKVILECDRHGEYKNPSGI